MIQLQLRLQQEADGGGLDAEQRIRCGRALHATKGTVEENGQKQEDDRYGMRLQGEECVGERTVKANGGH